MLNWSLFIFSRILIKRAVCARSVNCLIISRLKRLSRPLRINHIVRRAEAYNPRLIIYNFRGQSRAYLVRSIWKPSRGPPKKRTLLNFRGKEKERERERDTQTEASSTDRLSLSLSASLSRFLSWVHTHTNVRLESTATNSYASALGGRLCRTPGTINENRVRCSRESFKKRL